MIDNPWTIQISKTGQPVPCTPTESGYRPLHSLYDPLQEGLRMTDSFNLSGTVLAWGLGGAYHLFPLLEKPSVKKILIIEPSIQGLEICRSLESVKTFLQADKVFLWEPNQPLGDWIKKNYSPLWDGGLNTLTLRARTACEPELFNQLAIETEKTIQDLKADLSTQARFGLRWMKNLWGNLKLWNSGALEIWRPKKALVIGAGPSLEDQIETIKKLKPDLIISTDTAYPMLIASGIIPQVCLSLDPQITSYHHFVPGLDARTTFICDILSPTTLSRRLTPLFFASSHPLVQWMASEVGGIPTLDTSGGNVAWTGAKLGEFLDAEEVVLAGCDFSYPQGKTYARGTYVYPFFEKKSWRIDPLETQCYQFAFRTSEVTRELTPWGWRYTNALLCAYRDYWESNSESIRVPISALPGRGLGIHFPSKNPKQNTPQMFTNSKNPKALKAWVTEVYERTSPRTTDTIKGPLGLGLSPLAAYILKLSPDLEMETNTLWDKTKALARQIMEGYHADF